MVSLELVTAVFLSFDKILRGSWIFLWMLWSPKTSPALSEASLSRMSRSSLTWTMWMLPLRSTWIYSVSSTSLSISLSSPSYRLTWQCSYMASRVDLSKIEKNRQFLAKRESIAMISSVDIWLHCLMLVSMSPIWVFVSSWPIFGLTYQYLYFSSCWIVSLRESLRVLDRCLMDLPVLARLIMSRVALFHFSSMGRCFSLSFSNRSCGLLIVSVIYSIFFFTTFKAAVSSQRLMSSVLFWGNLFLISIASRFNLAFISPIWYSCMSCWAIAKFSFISSCLASSKAVSLVYSSLFTVFTCFFNSSSFCSN